MEILRIPPYPLTATFNVPEPKTNYLVVIEDIVDHIEVAALFRESDEFSKISISVGDELSQYDRVYDVVFYSLDEFGNRAFTEAEDSLEVTRPYVDVRQMVTTATEIKEYQQYERIARALIDSVCGGFYFDKKYIEIQGNDTDYLSLWDHTYKIIKVWENSVLVWDRDETPQALEDYNYVLIKDKSAIIKNPVQTEREIVRSASKPSSIMIAESDSFNMFDTEDSGLTFTVSPGVSFPSKNNYVFLVEDGWKIVPSDIQDATMLLIEDLKCGKLEYFKRHVDAYSTDQFRIQFNKNQFDGTGNIIVDRILDKYRGQTYGRYGAL